MINNNNTESTISQLEMLDLFLRRRNPDGYLELRPCYEQRRGIDVSARRWFSVDDFCNKKELIIEYCRQNILGCFVGVLSRTESGRGDSSAVDSGCVVWADIDDKDHNGSRGAVWSLVNGLPIEPSIIVESGGGLHLYYWIATDTPADDIADLNERLAALCGGDSCHDKARVLRLPCSYHQKDPDNVKLVKFVKFEMTIEYTIDELFSNFPAVTKSKILKTEKILHMPKYELSPAVEKAFGDNPRLSHLFDGWGKTGGDSTGSGYDFAFSKEALWVGLSRPDVVDALSLRIQRRGSQKSAVYITRTVERAYAVIQNRKNIDVAPSADPIGDPSVYVELDKYPSDHRDKSKRGRPVVSDLNLYRILTIDPIFKSRIRWNSFKNRIEVDFATENAKLERNVTAEWKRMHDVYSSLIRHEIAKSYGMQFRKEVTNEQIQFVAHQNQKHPVREYLSSLTWDPSAQNATSIDNWLIDFCDVQLSSMKDLSDQVPISDEQQNEIDSEINLIKKFGRYFLLSCIARVMQAGCKVDTVLILTGKQGSGKSTIFKMLARNPDWFRDSALNVSGGRDAYSLLSGVWIYEFPELHQTRTKDSEQVKAFISSGADSYRPAYAHYDIDVKRQCVFVGTSNESEILRDPTGSRRFWVVQTGEIELSRFEKAVDSLWAEAYHVYMNGTADEKRYFFNDGDDVISQHSEQFQAVDVWSTALDNWSSYGQKWTMLEIFENALGMKPENVNRSHQMRMSGILSGAGWSKVRVREGEKRVWKWKLERKDK